MWSISVPIEDGNAGRCEGYLILLFLFFLLRVYRLAILCRCHFIYLLECIVVNAAALKSGHVGYGLYGVEPLLFKQRHGVTYAQFVEVIIPAGAGVLSDEAADIVLFQYAKLL